jgi:hypothetical protein
MEIIKAFWQLPQIIAASIYLMYLQGKDEILDTCTYLDTIVFIKKHDPGSVTLGNYIFLSSAATDITVRHEWGHTRQSLMLGPLYLIIIGVPSILWAATHKYIAPGKKYAWFFTEAWANKLAGIS